MEETGLIYFNRAQQDLQKAQTIDKVIAIRNAAAELRLRAERRAGEMLRDGTEKGDRQAVGRPRNGDKDVTISPKLSEIGISKKQSSRWQSIAAIPEEKFEQVIREAKEAGEELTQKELLKLAGEVKASEKPKQEELFDLDGYRKKIEFHVSKAQHHMRQANHYRQQAFNHYGVQIPLPFEMADAATATGD